MNPIRRFPLAAAVYASGDFLIKASGFFLLPILTRYLSPADYGILAGVNAVALVLGVLFSLNLNSALMRLYGDCTDESERRNLVGSLILFSGAWALGVVILLNAVGPVLLDNVFKEVRFQPYIRIGTWIALLNSLTVLPLTLLQIQQRPLLHRTFALMSFSLNTGFTILFVVVFRMGAYGALVGQLVGGALAATPYMAFVRRHMNAVISPAVLKMCLAFSMPLLVYAIGGWFVDSSNRFFIERFMSLRDLGLFNVGNQIAMILGYMLNAAGLAFTPLFYETARLSEGPRILARFAGIYIAATLGLALVVAVFSRDAIRLLTQSQFHEAYAVVPILVLTQALTSFWHLIVSPLMLKNKTVRVMFSMLVCAAASIVFNFLLVPRYGIHGAAASSLLANLLLNAIVFFSSIRAYPVPYDYRRLGLTVLSAAVVYFVATRIPGETTFASVVGRSGIVALYPLLLIVLSIIDKTEVQRLLSWTHIVKERV